MSVDVKESDVEWYLVPLLDEDGYGLHAIYRTSGEASLNAVAFVRREEADVPEAMSDHRKTICYLLSRRLEGCPQLGERVRVRGGDAALRVVAAFDGQKKAKLEDGRVVDWAELEFV